MRIIIDYDGDSKINLTEENQSIKYRASKFGGYDESEVKLKPKYELLLPKEIKATVVLEETDVLKQKTLEDVVIKIDSGISEKELKESLFNAVNEQLKHMKLIRDDE